MEYRLTEQQQLVKSTVNSVLDKFIPDDQIRMVLEKEEFSKTSWNQLANDGWIGMFSSQDEGFTLLDLIHVSEAAGKKLYTAPLSLVSSYIVPVLSQLLSNLEKEKYLHPLISGERLMTAVLPEFKIEEDTEVNISWNRLETVNEQGNIQLSGTVEHVPFAQDADQILLSIENSSGGVSLVILETDAAGLTIQPENSIDYSRRLATITLNNVVVEEEKIFGGYSEDNKLILEKCLASYIQCLNSEMIGGAEQVLEMTVDYVKERKQFGQPLGVFQALKHKLADMSTSVENAKAFNYQTSWKLVNEPDFDLHQALTGRVYTAKLFKDVCEDSIQLFGGMGFTWEQDIHFWYKSAMYHQNHIAPIRTLKRYIFNNINSRSLIKS